MHHMPRSPYDCADDPCPWQSCTCLPYGSIRWGAGGSHQSQSRSVVGVLDDGGGHGVSPLLMNIV
jgi:hypothetical protein